MTARTGLLGRHCQNGAGDVCRASQRDGVVCPDDSCDIDDGIRPKDAPPADPSTQPHPHWNATQPHARHPQTSGAWDWRQDGPATGGGLARSLPRLRMAADRDDPRAPAEMALVLRIDLIRVLGELTWRTAQSQSRADTIAALRAAADADVGLVAAARAVARARSGTAREAVAMAQLLRELDRIDATAADPAPTSIAVDVQRDRVLVTGAGATLTLRDGSGYTPHRSPDAADADPPVFRSTRAAMAEQLRAMLASHDAIVAGGHGSARDGDRLRALLADLDALAPAAVSA